MPVGFGLRLMIGVNTGVHEAEAFPSYPDTLGTFGKAGFGL